MTIHRRALLFVVASALAVHGMPAAAQDGAMGATIGAFDRPVIGPYLIADFGTGLYAFTLDQRDGGTSACIEACAETWLPYTTPEGPQTTTGAFPEYLGTLVRPDGSVQVTYNGWPLYLYVSDHLSGDIKGIGREGFGGAFHLLTPRGELIPWSGG